MSSFKASTTRLLARAEKPSVFRREFVIHHVGREFTLAQKHAFTRTAAASLPHELPLPVRMFIVWLTMISWRREATAN